MKNLVNEIVGMNVKALLAVAKELKIVGRHEMKKIELVEAIMLHEKILQEELVDDMVDVSVLNDIIIDSLEEGLRDNVALSWEAIKDICEIGADIDYEGDINLLPIDLPVTAKYIKPRSEYVEAIKIGNIVAFSVNERKVISGAIEEIFKNDFKIRTKNGICFVVRKKNILWVKTGDRWPRGIYLALKGDYNSGCTRTN